VGTLLFEGIFDKKEKMTYRKWFNNHEKPFKRRYAIYERAQF